jgi:hypothetical protein
MVKQVPIVAGLLIAQGVGECLMGLFYVVMGPLMKTMMGRGAYREISSAPGMPPGFENYMLIFYVVAGLLTVTAGVLGIVAGIKGLKYRGRMLGLVGLISGVTTFLSCYCFPTALILLVYGLVVYLNSDVVRAFEMGERLSPAEIRATFE